jgi:hypothetical protein
VLVSGYDVTFGPDIEAAAAADEYVLMETIRQPDVLRHETRTLHPSHIHYDGERLVLPLAAADTADGTFGAIEVSSTPCIDQDTLDRLYREGSPRCVLPGREAVFRGFVTSPHFADGRADDQTTNVGVNFQSWRGFDRPGMRPAFIGVGLTYVGGSGFGPALLNRSWRKRRFVAAVMDANVGLVWVRPLEGFDPSEPHDLTLRWLPNRDIEFLVDGRSVGVCEDGQFQVSPLKLRRRFRKGIDLIGYRRITADPCSITAFTDAMSATPDFTVGRRLDHDIWTALSGMAIQPLE